MTPAALSLLPQLLVGATFVALMVADAVAPKGSKRGLALMAGVGVSGALVTAVLAVPGLPLGGRAIQFGGTIAIDGFALFFQVMFLGLTLLVLAIAPAYLDRHDVHRGEFYILLVASLLGMMVLVEAINLVTIFIGIELLSIALYVLSGFLRGEQRSQEAALKYLLIGSFATGFLLFGMALLYGGTGTTSLTQISSLLHSLNGDNLNLSLVGIALILVGLAFKTSAAPFHSWTPDVYQGAPAPVVAFMSVGTKLAALAALLRIFVGALDAVYTRWALLVGALAALSMIVGAVGALRQTDLRRMLAYSSVAQAGYLLIAVVAGQAGMVGALFYLAAYGLMTFGAFAVVTLLSSPDAENSEIEGLRGLGFRQPLLGGLLALFMLSLAGVPPTAGFMGKVFVFLAGIRAGYAGLAVIAITSSAISLYYYLRVVIVLYSTPPQESRAPHIPDAPGIFAVTTAGALTLLVGIFPSVLYGLAQRAALF